MFQPFAVAVAICSSVSFANTFLCKTNVLGEEVISSALFITFITESVVNNEQYDKSKPFFKPVNPPKLVNEEQL